MNAKRDAYNAMHRAMEKAEKKMEKGKEAQAAQASTPHPMLSSLSSGSSGMTAGGSQGSIGSGLGGNNNNNTVGAGSGKLEYSGSGGLSESSKDASKKKKEQKESKEAKEAAKNAINHQKVASDLAVARREFRAVNQSFQRYLRHLHARARFDFSQRTAAFLYAHKSYYQQGMTVYEFFGEDLLAVMTEMEEARKEFEANPNLEEALVGSNANRTGAQRMSMFLALDGGDKSINHHHGGPSSITSSPAAHDDKNASSSGAINKQGYMYKQSHKKVGKGWSMRWFILEETTLSWYSNWKDTQPSGTLTLNLCRIKPLSDKPLCMEVLQASPEVRIILRTLTEKDFASWHSALLQAVAYALSQDIPISTSSGADGSSLENASGAGNSTSSLLLPPFVSKRIPLDTQDILIQIQASSGIISLKEEGGEANNKDSSDASSTAAAGGHSREPSSPREASSGQHQQHQSHSSSGASEATGKRKSSNLAVPSSVNANSSASSVEMDSGSVELVADDGDDEHDTEEDRKKKRRKKKSSGKFASSSGVSMRDSSSSIGKSAITSGGGAVGPTYPAVNPQLSQSLLLSWLRRMHPSNQYCADCAAPNPDWCSINTGAILCIDCSGVHRSLGSHISKVRSLNMDSLKPAVQRFLLDVGNHTVNAIFEAKLGKYSANNENDDSTHSPQKSIDIGETPVIVEEDETAVASEEEDSSLSYEELADPSNPNATSNTTSSATRSRSGTTTTNVTSTATNESEGAIDSSSARSTPPSSPRLSARGAINRRNSPESTSNPATALGRVKDLSKKEKNGALVKPTPNADRNTRTKFIYAKYADLKFVKKKGTKALQRLASEAQHAAFIFPETAIASQIHLNPSMTLADEPSSHRLVRDMLYRDVVHEKLDIVSTIETTVLPSRTRRLNRALLRLVYEWGVNPKHEREGRNWVHEAAAANAPSFVSFFALQGSPPNVATSQQDGQSYAVHFAAISGSVECIQLVASTPNECAAKDAKGRTPLDTLLNNNGGDNASLKTSADVVVVTNVNEDQKRMKKMNSKRMSKMLVDQSAEDSSVAIHAAIALHTSEGGSGGSGTLSASLNASTSSLTSLSLSDSQLDVVDYLNMVLAPPTSTTPDLTRHNSVKENVGSATLSPSSSSGSTAGAGASSGTTSTRPARPGPSLISAKVEEVRKRSWTLSGRTSAKEASRMQLLSGDTASSPLERSTSPSNNTSGSNGNGPIIIGGASGDSTVAVPTANGGAGGGASASSAAGGAVSGGAASSASGGAASSAGTSPASASSHATSPSSNASGSVDISRPFGTEQPKFMSLRLKQKHSQHGPLSSIFGQSSGSSGSGASAGGGGGMTSSTTTSPLSSSTSSVAPPPPSLPSSPITLSASHGVVNAGRNMSSLPGASSSLSSLPSHSPSSSSSSAAFNGGGGPLSPSSLNRPLSPTRIKMLDDKEDGVGGVVGVGVGAGENIDIDFIGEDSSDEELQNALRSGEAMLDALISLGDDPVVVGSGSPPIMASPPPHSPLLSQHHNSTSTAASTAEGSSQSQSSQSSQSQSSPSQSQSQPLQSSQDGIRDKSVSAPALNIELAHQPKEKRGSGVFSRSKKDKDEKKDKEEKKTKKTKRSSKSPGGPDSDDSAPPSPTAPLPIIEESQNDETRSPSATGEAEEDDHQTTTSLTTSASPITPSSTDSASSNAPTSSDQQTSEKDDKKSSKKKDKESKDKESKDKDSKDKDKDSKGDKTEKKKIRPWALLRSFSVRETKKDQQPSESPSSVGPPAESMDSIRASKSFWKNMDRKNSEEQLEKKKLSPSPSASSIPSNKAASSDIALNASASASATESSDTAAAAATTTTQKKRTIQRSTTMATPSSSSSSGADSSLSPPSSSGSSTSPRKSAGERKNSKKSLRGNAVSSEGKKSSGEIPQEGDSSKDTTEETSPVADSESSSAAGSGSAAAAGASAPTWNPNYAASPSVTKKSEKRFTRANKGSSTSSAATTAPQSSDAPSGNQ